MFQGIMMPSSSGSGRPRKKKLLALLDPEDEGTIILCNIRNNLPDDTSSHPR
jgi:hypothetical protein